MGMLVNPKKELPQVNFWTWKCTLYRYFETVEQTSVNPYLLLALLHNGQLMHLV